MASLQVTALLYAGDTDSLFKQLDTEAIQPPRLALSKEKEIVQAGGSLQALKVLADVKYYFVDNSCMSLV